MDQGSFPRTVTVLYCLKMGSMLFAHSVKRIRGAAYKNSDVEERLNEPKIFPSIGKYFSVLFGFKQVDAAVRDHTVCCQRSFQKGLYQ